MDIKAKFDRIKLSKLKEADPELHSELEVIRTKTNDFANMTPTFEKNFNALYDMIDPGMLEEAKPAAKPKTEVEKKTPLSVIAPVLSTAKVIDLPAGVDSRKNLLKEVERCEEFIKENRAKVRELRGERLKKPVRRSPAERYAKGVQSQFTSLVKEVKDEDKVERLKKATHKYIAEIRSIMGYSIKALETKIETIASQAEKRIEKAA